MEDKSEQSYEAVLREIRQLIPYVDANLIMTDFEIGLRNACSKVFGDAHIAGCSFHYDQVGDR